MESCSRERHERAWFEKGLRVRSLKREEKRLWELSASQPIYKWGKH